MRKLVPPCCLLLSALVLAGCASSSPGRPDGSPPTSAALSPAPSPPETSPPGAKRPTTPDSSTAPVGGIGPVIIEPDAGMTPIYDFMRDATSTLTMTMYELVDPTAEQILVADATRGVRVQVLLDSALEADRNQPARSYLTSHGVAVAFGPVDRITHQKTICINDVSCLIMTLNLVAGDYATTRDAAVEDSDTADVSAIESTFAADFTGGEASATSDGDHLLWSPGSQPEIVGMIDGARHSVVVENEEMDSTAVTDALVAAARRGVSVEVCMTADSAYTDALNQIASAGGRIHLYPDSDGVLYIHEKLVIVDADAASAVGVVGSINFSTSSMDYNRELDIVLNQGDAASPLSALDIAFQSDFNHAPLT